MRLYVVTCESGCEWLVRASSTAVVEDKWEGEPILRIDPLNGDRAKAAYLRRLGQADC